MHTILARVEAKNLRQPKHTWWDVNVKAVMSAWMLLTTLLSGYVDAAANGNWWMTGTFFPSFITNREKCTGTNEGLHGQQYGHEDCHYFWLQSSRQTSVDSSPKCLHVYKNLKFHFHLLEQVWSAQKKKKSPNSFISTPLHTARLLAWCKVSSSTQINQDLIPQRFAFQSIFLYRLHMYRKSTENFSLISPP